MPRLTVEIEKDLMYQFKVKVTKEDRIIKEVVSELIRNYINEKETI